MPPAVQVGAILVQEWPMTTQLLKPESEPYSGTWRLIPCHRGPAPAHHHRPAPAHHHRPARAHRHRPAPAHHRRSTCCRLRPAVRRSRSPEVFWECPMPSFRHIRAMSNRIATWTALKNGGRDA